MAKKKYTAIQLKALEKKHTLKGKSAFQISGLQRIANNIAMEGNKLLAKIAIATEKTAVDVSNHAKANHIRGVAHGMGRFEVDTGILVKSITPELEVVNVEEVVAAVFTNMDYAIPVEFGTSKTRAYPFMFPALIANQENLKKRLAGAGV